MLDLHIPGAAMITLLDGVADEDLGVPTPCSAFTVRELRST